MVDSFDILIAGVGGQGNLVCGEVISDAAIRHGLSPVIGQIFGASRRGGTVFTHVRLTEDEIGPLIPQGRVDLILGLESLEALRASIEYGGVKTQVVFSKTRMETLASLSGEEEYPSIEEISQLIEGICSTALVIDAGTQLQEVGSIRTLNSYMIGIMIGLGVSPLNESEVESSINRLLGKEFPNLESFKKGVKDGKKMET